MQGVITVSVNKWIRTNLFLKIGSKYYSDVLGQALWNGSFLRSHFQMTSAPPITLDAKWTWLTLQNLSAPKTAPTAVKHRNSFAFIQVFLRIQESKQTQRKRYYGPWGRLLCKRGSNASSTFCNKYPLHCLWKSSNTSYECFSLAMLNCFCKSTHLHRIHKYFLFWWGFVLSRTLTTLHCN